MWGAVALASAGCAASAHQLQRGKSLERGQVEAVAAMALPLSSAAYTAAKDAAASLQQRSDEIPKGGAKFTDGEVRDLTKAGLALVLFSPLPSQELSARVGIGWDMDLGLRLSGPRTQIDVKWQFLQKERHGVDVALSLAGGRHTEPASSLLSSVAGVMESLHLLEYSRYDVSLALLASRDFGRWASLHTGLFYSRSRISVGTKVDEALAQAGTKTEDFVDPGPFSQVGGVIGGRLGYRWIFLTFELSAARVEFAPSVLDQQVDLSGVMISPALGLVLLF